MAKSRGRIIGLEMLRGLASVVVLVHHFLLGFLPARHGILTPTPPDGALAGTIAFSLINGTGAVVLFFCLSGYVLAARSRRCGGVFEGTGFLLSRYPRLMLPSGAILLVSITLLGLGLMRFEAAGAVTGSPWLADGAYGGLKENLGWDWARFVHDYVYGLTIPGGVSLNTNLWTIPFEFLMGGLVIIAGVVFARFGGPLLAGFVIALAAYSLWKWLGAPSVFFLPFLTGALLSFVPLRQIPMAVRLMAVVIGLYCLGFYQSIGPYAWMSSLGPDVLYKQVTLYTLGSALLVTASVGITVEGVWHQIWYWLGRVSFPVYLIHVVIIMGPLSMLFARFPDINLLLLFGIFVAMVGVATPVFVLVDQAAISMGRWLTRLFAKIDTGIGLRRKASVQL